MLNVTNMCDPSQSGSTSGGNIRRLGATDVRQICSAQVASSLSSAVKELIENSIDAGAKSIEIKVEDYGVKSVEVIDDGSGIVEDDFDKLARANCTSKIGEISDMGELESFGFRGQAMAGLASLGQLDVTTRHSSSEIAHRLTFDRNGHVISREKCPRPCGTSVKLCNLFDVFPVRRKEFQRTARSQYHEFLRLVTGFALLSDVRFMVTGILNGKRMVVLRSAGGCARENATALWGPVVSRSIVDLQQAMPDAELCRDFGVDAQKLEDSNITLRGLVSSGSVGHGRSTTDRQYIYLNKRSVDMPRLCRVANEAYKQYNASQYPVIVLDISVGGNRIDVNLSPNKRKILLRDEKELLAILKASMLKTLGETSQDTGQVVKKPRLSVDGSDQLSSSNVGMGTTTIVPNSANRTLADRFALKMSNSSASRYTELAETPSTDSSSCDLQNKTLTREDERQMNMDSFLLTWHRKEKEKEKAARQACSASSTNSLLLDESEQQTAPSTVNTTPDQRRVQVKPSTSRFTFHPVESGTGGVPACTANRSAESSICDTVDNDKASGASATEQSIDVVKSVSQPLPGVCRTDTGRKVLECSIQSIREAAATFREPVGSSHDHFSLTIPKDHNLHANADEAEDILARYVTQDVFERMLVIGQFNLGFIIARDGSQIFILDQHACDEKATFEHLMENSKVTTQPLIHPIRLELSAVDEQILIDSVDIFTANGFDIEIDLDKPPCDRTRLRGIPTVLNRQFDHSDVYELLGQVAQHPSVLYRPSRLRAAFASKACRSSVMIGTALTSSRMTRIVRHMATMVQPWNCPHGRPTLRHVCDLQRIGMKGSPYGSGELNYENHTE